MEGSSAKTRFAVGAMTGTSIDGMDASLVRIIGHGLDVQPTLLRHVSCPLGELTGELRAAAEQEPLTAERFATLAWRFGELHADVIGQLLAAVPGLRPDLICVHGQTV